MEGGRIHTYGTNLLVFNAVLKQRLLAFPNYWLVTDSMSHGKYVLSNVTVPSVKDTLVYSDTNE